MPSSIDQFTDRSTSADQAAFFQRLADRIAPLRPAGGGASSAGRESHAEAAEAAALLRTVLRSGDDVTLGVLDDEGRLVERAFRVRSPRMRVLLDAVVPFLEVGVRLRGAGEDPEALATLIRERVLAGDRLAEAAVDAVAAEVFGQPSGWWSNLPWESSLRALEVVFDLVPFGVLLGRLRGVAGRFSAGAVGLLA